MSASIFDRKLPQAHPVQGGDRTLAQSVFKGEARLRELEHLADTARKVRDQAAAELTRGSGATHHIARERIGIAERMLHKTQQEIAELRTQLAIPGNNGAFAPTSIPAKDIELAILLGHNRGRFNHVGGDHAPLELQQEFSTAGQRIAAATSSPTHRYNPADPASNTGANKASRTFGLLLILGLGIGALGTFAMVNHTFMNEAAQVVREGTEQLFIRIRTLLPTSDANEHTTNKAAFSRPTDTTRGPTI